MTDETPKLIIKCDDQTNPRKDYDNVGTMACWHNRYNLGDVQPKEDPKEWFKENLPPKDLMKSVLMPLYMYDHSGITIRTEPFSCPWDSGWIGWIMVRPEVIKKEFGDTSEESLKKAQECLLQEVKVYDQYLRGQCWSFKYGDDYCGGFVGDTLEETGLAEEVPEEAKSQVEEAWENRTGG